MAASATPDEERAATEEEPGTEEQGEAAEEETGTEGVSVGFGARPADYGRVSTKDRRLGEQGGGHWSQLIDDEVNRV